jgi:hypothetical protein
MSLHPYTIQYFTPYFTVIKLIPGVRQVYVFRHPAISHRFYMRYVYFVHCLMDLYDLRGLLKVELPDKVIRFRRGHVKTFQNRLQNCERRLLASSRVCPSFRMQQLGSHLTDFHDIWFLVVFRKSVEKIQVSLKSDKNNGYLTWGPIYIFDHISRNSSLNEVFQTKVVEKIKTHILCSVTFIFFESRAVYEIAWKNIVEWDRPQMKIWRMRIACWYLRLQYTLRMCNTYCFSTATMVAWTRLNVTVNVHCFVLFQCNVAENIDIRLPWLHLLWVKDLVVMEILQYTLLYSNWRVVLKWMNENGWRVWTRCI